MKRTGQMIPAEMAILHGRRVVAVDLATANVQADALFTCADCGNRARVAVIEVDEIEVVGHPAAWLWCGACDIGG